MPVVRLTFSDCMRNFIHDDIYIGLLGVSDDPLYPKEIQAFLESYAEHFDIVHRFQLNTKVTTVSRVGDKWSLLLTNAEGNREEKLFDRLVVCTGLFQTPKEPRVEGLDQFRGKILNAHTYKR